MRTIKNLFAAITLMVVISAGSTAANAGLLISDLTGSTPEPCTETTIDIVSSITGVIIHFNTGVIIHLSGEPSENCGVIIH